MVFRTNTIYCGDCQKVLPNHIPEKSVDVVYMDPPFFSNKYYEIIWGNGHELRAFEDRWKGGIENYISWMEPKLRECQRVLKDTGSMYLHCDWHAGHYLKVLMDDIFSRNNFQNEIVWCYGGGGASGRRFARKHDTIFFYSKTKDYKFNTQFAPYKEHSPFHSKGEPYRAEGKIMEDYWLIPGIGSTSKEKLGYPTQKPESLLERIIKTSSDPEDIVLDPMCGCGTAIAAAYKLNRKYIGVDVSPTACKLMLHRMHRIDGTIPYDKKTIVGYPLSMKLVQTLTPFEFQNYVCELIMARPSATKTGDFGVDGWLIDGRPLQVKQSERVGRNVIDNFETAIKRKNKTEGIIIAYSFGRGAYEEVARAMHDGLKIELKTIEDLLSEEEVPGDEEE
jgi:DNA modification methylase